MKTYVLTQPEVFPKTHARAGEPTEFREKFLKKEKIHTIRANYELWRKRIKEVQAGRAVLSVRQWTGKPYASPQEEIARLTAEDAVGVQKVEILPGECVFSIVYVVSRGILCKAIKSDILARNDGLSPDDWREWFKDYDLSKPMAIIHFTKFRY